jgi:hypothetical protein
MLDLITATFHDLLICENVSLFTKSDFQLGSYLADQRDFFSTRPLEVFRVQMR